MNHLAFHSSPSRPNTVSSIRPWLGWPLIAVMALSFGCAKIVVHSNPSGARIVYSDNGLPPWSPWRPNDKKDVTPSTAYVWGGTFRFFRAEKEGYYPSRPQLVDAFMFNIDKIEFELIPSPEQVAREKEAQGLIYWEPDGAWINPMERGLAQYKGEWMTPEDKLIKEKQDAGLVEYQGQWLAPEERDRQFAEDEKAAGKVLFEGRWVTPDEYAKGMEIMKAVDETFAETTSALPRAESVPQQQTRHTQLRFLNGTSGPINVYFAGPESFSFALEGFKLASHDLVPGRYRIAVRPVDPQYPAQTGTETFEDLGAENQGIVYSMSYQGEPGSLLEQVRSEKELYLQLPKIEIPDIPTPPEAERPQQSQLTDEQRALMREVMQKVASGELTMEQALQQLPEELRQSVQSGGMFGGRGGGPPGEGFGGRGEGGGRGGPPGEGFSGQGDGGGRGSGRGGGGRGGEGRGGEGRGSGQPGGNGEGFAPPPPDGAQAEPTPATP